PLKNNNFVAPGAAFEAARISPTGAFHQKLKFFPDTIFILTRRELIYQCEQARMPLFPDFFGHLVGHHGGGCILSGGVFKNESILKLGFASERKRLLKIVLSLARKSDDCVGGDSDIGLAAAKFLDDSEEALP